MQIKMKKCRITCDGMDKIEAELTLLKGDVILAPDGVWVGATLPAAPSVRSAKSRHFSMAK